MTEYSDPDKNSPLQLAIELIKRESVTPEDAGCMESIVQHLQPSGFKPTWLDFDDTRNLWLKYGDQKPVFAFLGHTDVVPTGPLDDWRFAPFEPTIHDGYLYGRGAADMKSSIAAFQWAAQQFVASCPEPKGSIALFLTSDEEGIATNGIVKAVEALTQQGEIMQWCLVGEPSSTSELGDVIKVGRRGSLCASMTVKGIQGHVAYPHLAQNPIHLLAPALADLAAEQWDNGNEYFPPTSLQVSNINSGTGAENVIPGQVDVLFNLRFSTELTPDDIKQRVHANFDRHQLDYTIHWRLSGNPFLTNGGELVGATQSALQAVAARSPKLSTAGGTSDGRFIAPLGVQVIELGPLNETIHKVNECVRVDDIELLAKVYLRILQELLG
ncbi:MAG: succinyl-diaminopimelate desuccinylase [Gammaproteobacteria bacterium]|nr:succinyl-diaminopimelate desuccinylase [Gammaproteobacteria bacterium]